MLLNRQRIRRALPLVLALGALPLTGDATNNIQCCSLATSFATSLFGGGNGDEDFFSVPAGSPNLMVLLSNSSTMLDFPNPLPFPTTSNWGDNYTALDSLVPCACAGQSCVTYTNGSPTCTAPYGPTYSAGVATAAAKATAPYDNGFNPGTTGLVSDTPPWGLSPPGGYGTCTAVTATGTIGTCLFNPNAYYYYPTISTKFSTTYYGVAPDGTTNFFSNNVQHAWSTAGAVEYLSLADICVKGGGSSGGHLPSNSAVNDCNNQLPNKGYLLFQDQKNPSNTNNQPAAFFAGWFLNLYPPKYILARKELKNLTYVDTAAPSTLDNVRFGLTVLNAAKGRQLPSTGITQTDGGELIVPLGPNCTVYPARQQDMADPRQALVNAVNNPALVTFYNTSGNATVGNQLAEALYDIGEYFSDYPSGSDPYTKLFGSKWVTNTSWNPSWVQSSTGAINASWAATSQRSFCWGCQQSSVLILSDGDPINDNNLPQLPASDSKAPPPHSTLIDSAGLGDFPNWTNPKIDCPGCGTDSSSAVPNLLHKVAAFLHTYDLRSDYSGMQSVSTYTISFGVSSPTAKTILQKTADLGGGTFSDAQSPADLAAALNAAANDIIVRATSFSVSNTTTLQTSQNTQLFLARFRPSESPAWEGHLFRFRIWNEFAEGCDPKNKTVTATCTKSDSSTKQLLADLNQDGLCSSIYILDGDCDPVIEDASGAFTKGSFDASHNLQPGTTAAKPFWDAGREMSCQSGSPLLTDPTSPCFNGTGTAYRYADETRPVGSRRMIYTLTDSNGDGQLTSADRMIELSTTLGATDWANLKAALGLTTDDCTRIFGKMGVNGVNSNFDLVNNTSVALNECAKQLVWFIRGYDVLDEDNDGCGGPDYPTNSSVTCLPPLDPTKGEERDRVNDTRPSDSQTFWKLGDIFHSSPVLVNPPATEFICDLALDNQCAATIHSPQALSGAVQTPIVKTTVNGASIDAYEAWRQDVTNHRQRAVLVGGNDGMLHAFDAGTPDPNGKPDAMGNLPYQNGYGTELWAFIPPDLLPKLKNALLGHDYFVDGNTMVRDIWVDGSGKVTGPAKDGTKQQDEFHTIAVLSERSGGTEYIALDLNDVLDLRNQGSNPPPTPKFLWMYPQPCSLDVSRMGQSWTGFAPRPPPIGPVKLQVPKNSAQDPMGRGFEERWIVMVNGGYDASMTRGRGIFMMDAWTGQEIWRFTNDEFIAQKITSTGNGGMWPVPGSAALLDIGKANQAKLDSDGFFDTATWGDIGGTIYVARFNSPDTTTWSAARAFEEQRQTDDTQYITGRSEFYYMPANTIDPSTGALHTYLGSGNREHLLTSGASCGPDNVFGCFQAGCNTDITTVYDYGSCSYSVKAHANNGTIKQDMSGTNSTACADTGIACNQIKVNFNVVTVCNGWKPVGGSFQANLSCDSSGNCSTVQHTQKGNTAPSSKLLTPTTHNRFYGVWAFGGASRTFDDWAGARTFDANRFTDIAYSATCAGTTGSSCTVIDATYAKVNSVGAVTCTNGTPCSAGSYDPGWMYEYGHAAACPLAGGCGTTNDWIDEKTGSGATILAGCVDWNTFRPMGMADNTIVPCQINSGTARNYTYLADFVSGVPSTTCGIAAPPNAIVRAAIRSSTTPPLDPTQMVSLGKDGQVSYSTAQIEPGIAPQTQTVGTGGELNQMIYWLEVPRNLHACRHADATQCE